MGFFKNALDSFTSGESNRKQLTKLYYKFYGKALAKGMPEHEAKADTYARLLMVRTKFTDYNFNRFKLNGELFPFMILEGRESLVLFIEYILFLEKNRDTDIEALTQGVNYALMKVIEPGDPDDEGFWEQINIIRQAINENFGWTQFINQHYKQSIFF